MPIQYDEDEQNISVSKIDYDNNDELTQSIVSSSQILATPNESGVDDNIHNQNKMRLYYENLGGVEMTNDALRARVTNDFGGKVSYDDAVNALTHAHDFHSAGLSPEYMLRKPKEELTVGDWLRSFSGHTSRMTYGTVSGLMRMTAGIARNMGHEDSQFYEIMSLAANDANSRGNELYNIMANEGYFEEDISDKAANDVFASNVGQLLLTFPVALTTGFTGVASINMGMMYSEGYEAASGEGLTDSEAHDAAGIYTLVASPAETAVDMLTAGLFKPFAKILSSISKPALRSIAKVGFQSASAALTGGPVEGGQYALLQKLIGGEITSTEVWANIRAGAIIEALGGGVISAGTEVDIAKAQRKLKIRLDPIFGERAEELATRIVESDNPQEEVETIKNEVVFDQLLDELFGMKGAADASGQTEALKTALATDGVTFTEIVNQAKAINIITGGDETAALKVIEEHAPEMREIIEGVEARVGRVPTPEEIVAEIKLNEEANKSAEFTGIQEGADGELIPLYNLKIDIKNDAGEIIHPIHSSVTAETLTKAGLHIPLDVKIHSEEGIATAEKPSVVPAKPQGTPISTEPMTRQQLQGLNESQLLDNDIDFLYEESSQRELFKQAKHGSDQALRDFNQGIVGAGPEVSTKPKTPNDLISEQLIKPAVLAPQPLTAEEIATENAIDDSAGSDEFNQAFGNLDLLTEEDITDLFEQTLSEQLEQLAVEDLTLEQTQFLEGREPKNLSPDAKKFYDTWRKIQPKLLERANKAAKELGFQMKDRGDTFFPLRKAAEFMDINEGKADWLRQKDDMVFGNVFARKKGVDPSIYDQNPVETVREYISGLRRMERAASINVQAKSIDLGQLAEATLTIQRLGGTEGLSPEQSVESEKALSLLEEARGLISQADALGFTIDLKELDAGLVDSINDIYKNEHTDINPQLKGINLAAQVFDGRVDSIGPMAKSVVWPTIHASDAKGEAVRTELSALSNIYRNHGMNMSASEGNKRLFDISSKYSPQEIATRDIETFDASEQKYIPFMKDFVMFMKDVAVRHGVDPKQRNELHRSDQQYWAEAFKQGVDKNNFANQSYVQLNKMLGHAYLSPAIRRLNLIQRSLRSAPSEADVKGYPKFAGFIGNYINSALIGDINQIDAGLGLTAGGRGQRSLRFWQGVRNRSHLVGNLGFLLGTQGTSIALTFSRAGFLNTMSGLFLAANPNSKNLVGYGPFEQVKRHDIIGAVQEATDVRDAFSGSRGFTREADKLMSTPSSFIERYLSRTSVIALYTKARQMKMNHDDAMVWADLNGTETQSNYRKEVRPNIQNSDVMKTLFAHQSFALTLNNHIQSILTNKGIPLSKKERVKQGISLMMAASIISDIMRRVTGRVYYTIGTAIPFIGARVDEFIEERLSKYIPKDSKFGKFLRDKGIVNKFSTMKSEETDIGSDIGSVTKALDDLIKHKNPKRAYKWMASYGAAAGGLGGGTSWSRLIDVLYARANDNEVQDVKGREMFSLSNPELFKSLIYGVYSSKEGREYIKGNISTEEVEQPQFRGIK